MFTTGITGKLLISRGNGLARWGSVEVGQQLFEARQRRHLTLDDISQSTKIPVSLLRAIECHDVARLPHEFFTRAFVRAYANEVGLNADELLTNENIGEVEQVAVEPDANVPIQEPSSSRSFFLALAALAACALYYSGFVPQATKPDVPSVAVASAVNPPQPAAFAPPPCTPVESAPPPIHSVRRTLVVASSAKANLPNQFEPTASAVDWVPPATDTVLPEIEPAPAPVPVDQF